MSYTKQLDWTSKSIVSADHWSTLLPKTWRAYVWDKCAVIGIEDFAAKQIKNREVKELKTIQNKWKKWDYFSGVVPFYLKDQWLAQ